MVEGTQPCWREIILYEIRMNDLSQPVSCSVTKENVRHKTGTLQTWAAVDKNLLKAGFRFSFAQTFDTFVIRKANFHKLKPGVLGSFVAFCHGGYLLEHHGKVSCKLQRHCHFSGTGDTGGKQPDTQTQV